MFFDDDHLAAAAARPLVTVEPKVQDRPHGKVLVLPPDAGYGVVDKTHTEVMAVAAAFYEFMDPWTDENEPKVSFKLERK